MSLSIKLYEIICHLLPFHIDACFLDKRSQETSAELKCCYCENAFSDSWDGSAAQVMLLRHLNTQTNWLPVFSTHSQGQ